MNQSQLNAMTELQIIQIELANGRDYHMRHTIDQWFCYANDIVTKSGKASPEKLEGTQWVSEGYRALPDDKKNSTHIVKKEHVVPLSVIKGKLRALSGFNLGAIQECLEENLLFATITKEEDAMLKAIGCNDSMPAEYYDESHELYMDPWARYEKAGIIVTRA